MKRRELIRHLEAHGCGLLREGGRHSVYWNPASRRTSAVPRHTEIIDVIAKKICRDLDVLPPQR
jgi:mRNA interferase HicA